MRRLPEALPLLMPLLLPPPGTRGLDEADGCVVRVVQSGRTSLCNFWGGLCFNTALEPDACQMQQHLPDALLPLPGTRGLNGANRYIYWAALLVRMSC